MAVGKRIAIVLSDLSGGGAERSSLGIARGLVARGYTVDLVLFSDLNAYPHETPREARLFVLRSTGEKRFRERVQRAPGFGARQGLLVCIRLLGLIRNVRSIAAYIERERPDVLFPVLGPAKVSTILARFFVSSHPIVIPVVQNVVMNRPLLFRLLYRLLFPAADRVVAISEGVADSLIRKLAVPREKIETIYNPVTRPEIDVLAGEVPEHPWMSEKDLPVFLAVGRLAPAKDFMTLLRAFHRGLPQSARTPDHSRGGAATAAAGAPCRQDGFDGQSFIAGLVFQSFRLHEPCVGLRRVVKV